MPKEKWFIDPSELDEFQLKILQIGINQSYIIKGCAGSGKTILALHRVNEIRVQAILDDPDGEPSFTMVVSTVSLRQFVRSGIRALNINLRQIVQYDQWDADTVDHLIVDEAQDFAKDEIETLNGANRKSIMFYGDSQQQIYRTLKEENNQVMLTLEEIASFLGLPTAELLKNYRLPKEVASFASHLCDDQALEQKCVKMGLSKPAIHSFRSWTDELNFIMREIKTRNYTDVAILVPFNIRGKAPKNNFHRNVQEIHEYFLRYNFPHECKMSLDE
jgi:hypothetical protein